MVGAIIVESVFGMPRITAKLTSYSEVLFPTKANAFPNAEANSLADCGRSAVLGLSASSKNCCHSAGAAPEDPIPHNRPSSSFSSEC